MKQRPLTELTSCLVTVALRDNVVHILHLDLDSRTGQGGRGWGRAGETSPSALFWGLAWFLPRMALEQIAQH